MNKTWIKEHWLEILLCVGIVIQIGALAVFNLTRLPYESNYDIRPLWVLIRRFF